MNHISLPDTLHSISDRIKIIANDGTVLFDNITDIKDMENHLDRPEVKSSFGNRVGRNCPCVGYNRKTDILLCN